LISNYLKRERIDTDVESSVPPKKKRKMSRGKSRKRIRAKSQFDSIRGHKAKKACIVELEPKSPDVDETIDVNIDLPVSKYFNF